MNKLAEVAEEHRAELELLRQRTERAELERVTSFAASWPRPRRGPTPRLTMEVEKAYP